MIAIGIDVALINEIREYNFVVTFVEKSGNFLYKPLLLVQLF